jgi:hypothetical protein
MLPGSSTKPKNRLRDNFNLACMTDEPMLEASVRKLQMKMQAQNIWAICKGLIDAHVRGGKAPGAVGQIDRVAWEVDQDQCVPTFGLALIPNCRIGTR